MSFVILFRHSDLTTRLFSGLPSHSKSFPEVGLCAGIYVTPNGTGEQIYWNGDGCVCGSLNLYQIYSHPVSLLL